MGLFDWWCQIPTHSVPTIPTKSVMTSHNCATRFYVSCESTANAPSTACRCVRRVSVYMGGRECADIWSDRINKRRPHALLNQASRGWHRTYAVKQLCVRRWQDIDQSSHTALKCLLIYLNDSTVIIIVILTSRVNDDELFYRKFKVQQLLIECCVPFLCTCVVIITMLQND